MINIRELATEYRLTRWAVVIQEGNASGLSIKAYCESIGNRPNVYFYWQRSLREAACKELLPAPLSIENTMVPNGWSVCSAAPPPALSQGNELTVEIGKSRVNAIGDIDIKRLRAVCQMLMTLC